MQSCLATQRGKRYMVDKIIRKPKEKLNSKELRLKFNIEDYKDVENKAKRIGLKMTQYARYVLLNGNYKVMEE